MISKSLITINEPLSFVSESYKMFRTNLNYVNIDKELKIILFASGSKAEGKTTTVANTGITLAQGGKKVLVLECDLRLARIHTVFDMNQSPGLTNVLAGNNVLENSIQKVPGIDNLDVLSAGALPPSPSELLSSKTFEKFLGKIREDYDVILIDAPPVLHVSDAGILARLVDGVVLVIASDLTKKEDAARSKKMLEQVDANILGVILTKTKIKKDGYYRYGG